MQDKLHGPALQDPNGTPDGDTSQATKGLAPANSSPAGHDHSGSDGASDSSAKCVPAPRQMIMTGAMRPMMPPMMIAPPVPGTAGSMPMPPPFPFPAAMMGMPPPPLPPFMAPWGFAPTMLPMMFGAMGMPGPGMMPGMPGGPPPMMTAMPGAPGQMMHNMPAVPPPFMTGIPVTTAPLAAAVTTGLPVATGTAVHMTPMPAMPMTSSMPAAAGTVTAHPVMCGPVPSSMAPSCVPMSASNGTVATGLPAQSLGEGQGVCVDSEQAVGEQHRPPSAGYQPAGKLEQQGSSSMPQLASMPAMVATDSLQHNTAHNTSILLPATQPSSPVMLVPSAAAAVAATASGSTPPPAVAACADSEDAFSHHNIHAALLQLDVASLKPWVVANFCEDVYMMLLDAWRADSPKIWDAVYAWRAHVRAPRPGGVEPDYRAFLVSLFGLDKLLEVSRAAKAC